VADERNALHDLIRRGRRRQVWHLLVHAASFAAVVGMGGAILLLVVGAQILNWYWLVVLFGGSLVISAVRSRSKLLTSYQVAQSIDRRLDFKDALSTAYYFGRHPDRAASPEFVRQQRSAAEDVARSADVDRGVPFLMPRTAYVNLALVAVAFGMFGLRYGIHRSLDLGSPLVHIRFDGLFGTSPQTAKARAGRRPGDPDSHRDPGAPAETLEAKNDLDPSTETTQQSIDKPDTKNASISPDAAAKADAKSSEQLPPEGNPLDSGDKNDSSKPSDANANASPGADSKSGQQNPSKDAPKDSKDASQSGSSGDNSNLGSKLRDALSNLLAKMKPQQSKPGAGKPNESSQSANSRSSQQGEKQEGAQKSPGQEQADASANSQSEGDQQQGGTEQASQGKSEGRSNNQPNSPDGKSGIGKQDGDKAAREAAELAAMGKLSEIIGKRAANIQGEVMVEVSSGKQQLKTQYSQQNAAHVEAGGEINRDEVPLAYQQYVQQYFAQVRKLPAGKSKASPDSKSSVTPDSKTKATPSSLP
jgi:hypothetical protein